MVSMAKVGNRYINLDQVRRVDDESTAGLSSAHIVFTDSENDSDALYLLGLDAEALLSYLDHTSVDVAAVSRALGEAMEQTKRPLALTAEEAVAVARAEEAWLADQGQGAY